jgi:uncharacterized membrane protein
MSDKSSIFHIVAFAFAGQKTAKGIASDVKTVAILNGYKVVTKAVVEQDAKGKVHFSETGKGGVGTTVGAVTGGILALIGGPAGLLAWTVAGGVIGGLAGKYLGRVIPADELKKMGEALEPDSSAFMVIIEDRESEKLINDMDGFNANVITMTVGSELSGEIAQFVAAEAEIDPAKLEAAAEESEES